MEFRGPAAPGDYLKITFGDPRMAGTHPISALLEIRWTIVTTSGTSKIGGQFVAIRDADLSRLSQFLSQQA